MNSSRCSRVGVVAVAMVLLLVSAAVPVSAILTVDKNVPDEARVGTKLDASIMLEELYQNPQSESWQLSGKTELANVTWTVVYYDQTGAQTNLIERTGQSFSGIPINASTGTSAVEVRITGTVPEVASYNYSSPQEFLLMQLTRGQEGGASSEVDTWRVHHYTESSRSAREAIDEARAAINEAESNGVNPTEAKRDLQNAISSFNDGSFEVAIRLAQQATDKANQAQQSSQNRQTLIFAGIGVVALIVVAGAAYWWRSRDQPEDPLG